MMPIEPTVLPAGAKLVLFAKDQPEYHPLPAAITPDGVVMTEWEFTAEELHALFTGGKLRVWTYTCNQPLQPMAFQVVARP